MLAIKRIIPHSEFSQYNIPDSFGKQAEMIIIPADLDAQDSDLSLYNSTDQGNTVQLLSEPEEEFQLLGVTDFFETNDDKNINWEEYFGTK
jgi:hypothetical protein